MKFTKDCAFVSFEVEGDAEVDLIGYVTGLDTQKMMSLKEAMELSDASDDEDYVEEEEEEKEEEEEEKISEPTEEKPKEPVKYERLEELPRDKVDFNVEGSLFLPAKCWIVTTSSIVRAYRFPRSSASVWDMW